MKGLRFIGWSLFVLIVTILIPLAARHATMTAGTLRAWAVVTYVVDLCAVGAVVLGFGYAVTGKPFGIALSTWNDYSLSRLQMALWTIVVLAALMTAAKLNLLGYFGPVGDDPLNITIPPELLAAMGIAAFSTAATPAILALKASQGGSTSSDGTVQAVGNASGFVSSDSASWFDIVSGDEVANAGTVDLSKVQQLLVTILLLGTYIFMLIHMFATAGSGISGLPILSQYFIELMALSHAGYLAYKATPKSGQVAAATPDDTAAPPTRGIPVLLTIDDADSIAGLNVSLDGKLIAIGGSGFAELTLSPSTSHTFVARGTRGGSAVNGSLSVSVTTDDINKPIAFSLA